MPYPFIKPVLKLLLLSLAIINIDQSYAERSICGLDRFEPNNLRSKARNVSIELKHAREVNAKVCLGDDDWYTVWLNRGDLVDFIVNTPLAKPPQIAVYPPRKRKPL